MDFNQAKRYLKELLTINSVEDTAEPNHPFGKGVADCLDKALAILDENGFRTRNVDYYCGWGEIGEGDLFGILCHLDVVPIGKGWHYPPFGATEENNRIYARGALDDKSPFIGALYAVTRLLAEGKRPTKRIRFILGCDEESGWKCMDRYVQTEEMPSLGISPDGDFPVINCEKGIVYHTIGYPKPDGLEYITAGERPNMVPDCAEAKVRQSASVMSACLKYDCVYDIDGDYVTIKTSGKASHGSHPENGDNALIKLTKILAADYPCLNEIYLALGASDGSGVGLTISDAKSGALTLNLGTARTDDENILFELDIRHPVTVDKDYVTNVLKSRLKGEVIQGFFHLPLYVDKEHPLVKALLSAYNKVTGENAEPLAIGGGTYARVLPLGVAFGPCFPDSKAEIHCADEYLDLDEFKKSVDIYYEAFKTLCFE